MKGARMSWMYEEEAERRIRCEGAYLGWTSERVEREMAMISTRWDAEMHPEDLMAVTAELDHVPGYEYGECDYVTAFTDACTAFRAVFAEVA